MDQPTPTPCDFKAFYQSLDPVQRDLFATLSGTRRKYIETHLLYARRVPRKARLEALWQASRRFGAAFSYAELLAFFLGDAS